MEGLGRRPENPSYARILLFSPSQTARMWSCSLCTLVGTRKWISRTREQATNSNRCINVPSPISVKSKVVTRFPCPIVAVVYSRARGLPKRPLSPILPGCFFRYGGSRLIRSGCDALLLPHEPLCLQDYYDIC